MYYATKAKQDWAKVLLSKVSKGSVMNMRDSTVHHTKVPVRKILIFYIFFFYSYTHWLSPTPIVSMVLILDDNWEISVASGAICDIWSV